MRRTTHASLNFDVSGITFAGNTFSWFTFLSSVRKRTQRLLNCYALSPVASSNGVFSFTQITFVLSHSTSTNLAALGAYVEAIMRNVQCLRVMDGQREVDKMFIYLLDYQWEVSYPLNNTMQKKGGFTVLEVLISAGLFTIVVLGISQTVLTMHRYARSNLCKMQAHLFAVSVFEQLLCDTHPYEVDTTTNASISLRDLGNPSSRSIVLRANNATSNTSFTRSVYEANDLSIELKLTVQNSPLYNDYGTKSRTEINPPEGFQALRLVYSWATPTVTNLADKSTWFSNELYAIRPITPDDPNYDV